ncbi:hypothetical protein HYO65_gp238 [Tenacibaculum phage PTm1]|uniref:Uncharacterized protein n=2 Tax=Shirahamavirus PTm1 TaxID=2846435 RepID=A0A5S9HXD3_9CAUD|nr:hypothetical protein HYO65_gp238 [Tenacibaculum phage PTm1]BBI90630.1 hypothetical protein [Tenacibaculum phage PTm1]BBI90936.1 hypothetical protein [Tenacibaculum phage PTm5]
MRAEDVNDRIHELESKICINPIKYFDDINTSCLTEFELIYFKKYLTDYISNKLKDGVLIDPKSRIGMKMFKNIEILLDKCLSRVELYSWKHCDHTIKGFLVYNKIKEIRCPNCGTLQNPPKNISSFVHTFNDFRVYFNDLCNSKHTNISRQLTNLKKYGYASHFSTKETREKIRKTNLIKYGVDNPTKYKEINDRIIETKLKRYGTLSFNKYVNDGNFVRKQYTSKECEQFLSTYITPLFKYYGVDDNIMFGDKEYSVLIPNTFNDVLKHVTMYDFYSPKYSIIFEYHGSYWHNNEKAKIKDREKLEFARDYLGIMNYFTIWDYQAKDSKLIKEVQNEIIKIIDEYESRVS